MGKYYKLYINNNNRKMLFDSHNCDLEDVILKTRKVLKDKKTIFGKKKVEVDQEYLDKTIIIVEKENNKMVDLVTGDIYELSESFQKTNTGFNVPVEEENFNTPKLSYYKKEEILPSQVVEILKQYTDEDLIRYKNQIEEIKLLSKNNYEKYKEHEEKLIIDINNAEEYIKRFKSRCRK